MLSVVALASVFSALVNVATAAPTPGIWFPSWLVPISPINGGNTAFGSTPAPIVQPYYDVQVAFDVPARLPVAPGQKNICRLYFVAPIASFSGTAATATQVAGQWVYANGAAGAPVFFANQIAGPVIATTNWNTAPRVIPGTTKKWTLVPGGTTLVDVVECGDSAQQGWQIGQVDGAVLSWFETATPTVGFVLIRSVE